MSNKTRKHIWSGALVLSLAVVGVLAAFVVLAGNPATTDAHSGGAAGSHCAGENEAFKKSHDALTPVNHPKCADDTPPNHPPMAAVAGLMDQTAAPGGTITVDVSSHFTDEDGDTLTITAESSNTSVADASASNGTVMVTIASGASDGDTATITVTADDGNGGKVSDTFMVTVRAPATDAFSTGSTSASASIEVKVTIGSLPMDAEAGSSIEVYLEDDFQVPGSIDRDTVYFRVTNPRTDDTNDGGRVYSADPIDVDDGDHFGGDDDHSIRVYIPDMNTSDDADGYQGPAMGQTITLVFTKAAGIKNPSEAGGHSAAYRVLDPDGDANGDGTSDVNSDSAERGRVDLPGSTTVAKISLSDEDNTRGYELTVTGSGFNNGTTAGVYVLHSATEPTCQEIIDNGANVGGETVGSDDKATVTFEVTVPTFMAGDNNYICMVDGEGRMSDTDVEQFELEPSIRVVPTEANAGDTVNVFGQDYPNAQAGLDHVKLANKVISATSTGPLSASFVVPGGLKGTLRVDASWGGVNEDAKITIAPSVLTLSKDEVVANESITIRGSDFGDGAGCLVSATISGVPLKLVSDDDVSGAGCNVGGTGNSVEVSSAGQFAATVAVWPASGSDNPALTAGIHVIEVMDNDGFTGTATITIKSPTLTVTPDVAGPRDYITISGTNWPAENDDGGRIDEVQIEIGNGIDDEDADPDASGRWSVQYRVDRDVTIPSTVQVKATYGASDIVEISSFSVPAATLVVSPMRAAPGDTITLSASGFAIFESDVEVKIGSASVNVPDGTYTDRDGAIEALEVVVPGLDPALYTVQLKVEDTVTIGELTVLDDAVTGVAAELPGAVSDLGDNLDAIFHFNNTSKAWTFYDPRPEFADLNTLSELVGGQPYWVLVKENQEDVNWNGRLIDFTCAGGDCWNLEIW